MGKHRSNEDDEDDTAPIGGILKKMVKLSSQNENRPKVERCGLCNGKQGNYNCGQCAGTGVATDWN